MAGGVQGETIVVQGLAPLYRSFSRMSPILRRDFRTLLRRATLQVAARGREIAGGEGLIGTGTHGDPRHQPGQLIAKITPRISARGGSVIDTAATTTAGYGRYPYPRRIEYSYRPFLRPALEQTSPLVETLLSEMFDEMVSESGFAGGL